MVKRELDALSLRYAFEGKGAIEYFLPVCFMRLKRAGDGKITTRKMVFSYVFILSTEREIAAIKKALPQLRLNSPLSAKTGKRKNLSMRDYEMSMFRKIADAFAGQLPCYNSDMYDLSVCDRVRVINGPFTGIEGAMVTTKGKRNGQVLLPMCGLFHVSTGDLPTSSYVVLEFGEGNRHPYHAFENYLPHVTKALEMRLSSNQLDEKSHAALLRFTVQYGKLQTKTLNIESTYSGLMLMSHAALGNEAETAKWLEHCNELLPKLKAELQLGMQLGMMYAATGDDRFAANLHQLINDWGELKTTDRKKKNAVNLLEQFEKYYATAKKIV